MFKEHTDIENKVVERINRFETVDELLKHIKKEEVKL